MSDSAAPWTVAHQAPLSMGFSRPEYWSGLPCPPPGDRPGPGMEPESLMSPVLAGGFFTTSTIWETVTSFSLVHRHTEGLLLMNTVLTAGLELMCARNTIIFIFLYLFISIMSSYSILSFFFFLSKTAVISSFISKAGPGWAPEKSRLWIHWRMGWSRRGVWLEQTQVHESPRPSIWLPVLGPLLPAAAPAVPGPAASPAVILHWPAAATTAAFAPSYFILVNSG